MSFIELYGVTKALLKPVKNITKNITGIFLMILLIIVSYACSSSETVIKDRKISINVPALKDTLPAVYENIPKAICDTLEKVFNTLPDSAVIETVRSDNPKIKIKYFPKKKYFQLDVPAQKFDTTFTDTTKYVIKKQTTTAEKFGYATYGIIIFLILGVIVFVVIKFKLVK